MSRAKQPDARQPAHCDRGAPLAAVSPRLAFAGAGRALVALALFALAALGPARTASAQEPLKVVLAITDVGFECRDGCEHVTLPDAWQPVISVDQGALVQIDFVWAHVGYVDEEHIMVLEGYGLEWDKIDGSNREASLQLIADLGGEFKIKCDTECEVHDYTQNVLLRVGASGAQAAAKTPSKLVMTPSAFVTAGEPVSLMVTLKGEDGKPVPKADVDFYVDTELAAVEGEMKVGSAETDDNGVAFLDFTPTLPVESETVRARFDGLGIYAGTEAEVVIQTVGQMPPAYRVQGVGLEALRASMPRAFGLAILAIWLVLGYIVLQIVGILRAQPGA